MRYHFRDGVCLFRRCWWEKLDMWATWRESARVSTWCAPRAAEKVVGWRLEHCTRHKYMAQEGGGSNLADVGWPPQPDHRRPIESMVSSNMLAQNRR